MKESKNTKPILIAYEEIVVENQECTDAAPEEPHPRPTRLDAVTREGRCWPRVRAASSRVLPREFLNSRRRGSNRAISAEYRCVSAGKRKSAGKKKKKFKTETTGGFDTQSSPA